jgi:transcriptional regulator with XRE-family HTH domain
MNRTEARVLIDRILKEGTFTLEKLADLGGLSPDAAYSWSSRGTTPRRSTFARLAVALEKKAQTLLELAEEARRLASTDDDPPATRAP